MNRDEVEIRAFKCLEECNAENYPVDVEMIAECLGIKIVLGKLDGGVSGFFYKEDEINMIGVNIDHHIKRQRFTIAHEIGHFDLHVNHLGGADETFVDTISSSAYFNRDRGSAWGIDNKEKEANAYAAALLMPETLISECLAKYIDRYSSIEDIAWKMAKDFNVSEQAMTIRLINLKIFEIDE